MEGVPLGEQSAVSQPLPGQEAPYAAAPSEAASDEPKPVFTILAIAAMLLLMFSCWMTFAQLGRIDWNLDTSVPILSDSNPVPNLSKCKE